MSTSIVSLTEKQTGQLHPSLINHARSLTSKPLGNEIETSNLLILLGFAAMCFSTLPFMPLTSIPLFSALMAIIVITQLSIEVASKSVGENDSPLPLLSVGASVNNVAPDFVCVAVQRKFPS